MTDEELVAATEAKGLELREQHAQEEAERSQQWRAAETARLAVRPQLVNALTTVRAYLLSGERGSYIEVLAVVEAALNAARKDSTHG